MTLNPDIQDVVRKEPVEDDEYIDEPPTGRTIDAGYLFGTMAKVNKHVSNMNNVEKLEFYRHFVNRLIMRAPEYVRPEFDIMVDFWERHKQC